MYPYLSKHVQTYPNIFKHIKAYPIVSELVQIIQTYQHLSYTIRNKKVSKCHSFTKAVLEQA